MISELYRHRRAFWSGFAHHAPDLYARTEHGTEHSRWLFVGPRPLVVAMYVGNASAGIFVRGARGVRTPLIREYLFPYREILAQALGRPDLKLGTYFPLASGLKADMQDGANWPRAFEWFAANVPLYERALLLLQRP